MRQNIVRFVVNVKNVTFLKKNRFFFVLDLNYSNSLFRFTT